MVVEQWQAYVQQIVMYVSRGYVEYCEVRYPERKIEKWPQIDLKLATKYDAGLSRYQRARRKAAGKANHVLIRWDRHAVILRSPGVIPELEDPDTFVQSDREPIKVVVSPHLTLLVSHDGARTIVRMDRDTYREVWSGIDDALCNHRPDIASQLYNRLNGIPSYGGINTQRRQIRERATREAKRHGVPTAAMSFRVVTRRKMYVIASGHDAAQGESCDRILPVEV